ncbi:MAG: ATP-NAD kinase [Oleiphilus sp.]|nr:MAG: ATP-NAD kinase [Oleiphilus sp.]
MTDSIVQAPDFPVFRLGLVINPLAGLGGAAGLKGSDHPDTAEIARQRGVVSRVAERVVQVFQALADKTSDFQVLTASGTMGSHVLEQVGGVPFESVYHPSEQTTAEDTCRAARAIRDAGVDLILFAGGDGTARDIYRALGDQTPVLGIPAGVKMHSGVFAVTPEAAASVVHSLLSARLVSARPAEVRDIDEEAFANGRVMARYYGEMLVPDDQLLVQKVKCAGLPDDALMLEELAVYMAELCEQEDALWVLGPGGTLREIKLHLGIESPTLLGVDLWYRGECVLHDAYEAQIFEWLETCTNARLVLSIIGGQGIVLGRGNQQISPRVIETIGLDKVQFVATQEKLRALNHRALQVDSGSAELDKRLQGYHRIICGYEDAVLYPVGLVQAP